METQCEDQVVSAAPRPLIRLWESGAEVAARPFTDLSAHSQACLHIYTA